MIAARWQQAADAVDAMSLRERVLVFTCLTVATLLGWYQFAMLPVLDTGRQAVDGIGLARDRIDQADAAVRSQASQLGLESSWTVESQLDAARRRAAEIDALINARAAEIVDPATMTEVLEDMLTRQRDLRLISARNLKAKPLADTADDAPLFQHTLELELKGSYLAVLDYLEALEALPWRIYWQAVEIDTVEYPTNRIVIHVSTLSFDRDWIGV